jgi:hypothetical protein
LALTLEGDDDVADRHCIVNEGILQKATWHSRLRFQSTLPEDALVDDVMPIGKERQHQECRDKTQRQIQ